MFTYRIISMDAKKFKKNLIFFKRGREWEYLSKNHINFSRYASPSYYSTEKIKKTSDDFENSFALSDYPALSTPG